MITDGINGIGCDLSYRFGQDVIDILGLERVELIDIVTHNSIKSNIVATYEVAVSGALRWRYNLRPEVMIDATGRLL